MTKAKYLIIAIFAILLLIPNVVNAADVSVTRNIYSNNGSMKFEFKGLTLDKTHEYEFGLTKTVAAEVVTWHLITEYTETTAVVDVTTTTKDLRDVINVVDTGYITIKDKTINRMRGNSSKNQATHNDQRQTLISLVMLARINPD